jgi:integrase/recombinase XerC
MHGAAWCSRSSSIGSNGDIIAVMSNNLTIIRRGELDQALDSQRLIERWTSGRSPNTVDAYMRDLAHFAGWMGAASAAAGMTSFLSLTMGEANEKAFEYRGAMVDKGVAPATVNRRLAALRSIVKLGRQFGMVGWMLEIEGVKSQAYRDTRGPGVSGVAKAKGVATSHRDDMKAARDVAIMRLLYDMALRRSEVCSLDVEHVDVHTSRIAALRKGKREREWRPMPPQTLRAVQAWMKLRGKHPGPLFVSLAFWPPRGTERLRPDGLYRALRKIGKDAEILLRPHGLRHAGITAGLDKTKDPRAVQRYAGHASMDTTMIYDDNREDLGARVALVVADTLPE